MKRTTMMAGVGLVATLALAAMPAWAQSAAAAAPSPIPAATVN